MSGLLFANDTRVSTVLATLPFYTNNANPQNGTPVCLSLNLTNGTSCEVTWNVNASGSVNQSFFFVAQYQSVFSSAVNTSLINLTIRAAIPVVISQCTNISVFIWNANISLGTYDQNNKLYNQTNILPLNNSACGFSYALNNSANPSSVNVSFSSNFTDVDRNWSFYVDALVFNQTAVMIEVLGNSVRFVNVSINMTNYPVLHIVPDSVVTVMST